MYDEAGVPFNFFHTGGDELPDGAWMDSPLCQSFLDQLDGVKNTTNLNAMCFNRMVEIVNKYASLIGGWEEVGLKTDAEGNKHPNPQFAGKNVVPYVWCNLFGEEDLGYRLANTGYPVILCNVSNFYFDLVYDKDPLEAGLTWGGMINAKDAFYFAPFHMFRTTVSTNRGKLYTDDDFKGKEKLKTEARKNIMGLQAQLWSETMSSPERIEYSLLPKLLGFSYSAWSPERSFEKMDDRESRLKNFDMEWNIFANTVGQREMQRLDYLFGGYGYRLDPPGAVIRDGKLYANCEFPGLEIRYATDGSDPVNTSPLYTEPVEVTGVVHLKTFDTKGRSSRTSIIAE
jgi:hexosaminidase